MRTFIVVMTLVIIAIIAASAADAQRWRRYEPPFTPAWANPQLHVFPDGGPGGTEVQIRGAKFHDGLRVFYGDRPMRILDASDRHIVAMIPWDVRHDDYIYVVDRTGRARTVVPFAVHRPRSRYYDRPPGRSYERSPSPYYRAW